MGPCCWQVEVWPLRQARETLLFLDKTQTLPGMGVLTMTNPGPVSSLSDPVSESPNSSKALPIMYVDPKRSTISLVVFTWSPSELFAFR